MFFKKKAPAASPKKDLEQQVDTNGHVPQAKKRRAHDIFWLVLFVLVSAGMIAITVYSFMYGSWQRLHFGRDSEGNYCGCGIGVDSKRDLKSTPYLYYFNLANPKGYRRCVDTCPDSQSDGTVLICKYDVTPSPDALKLAVQIANGTCVRPITSISIFQRCIPQLLVDSVQDATVGRNTTTSDTSKSWANTLSDELNERSIAQKIFQDIYPLWWIVLFGCVMSMILSMIWLLCIRFTARIVIWLTVILLLLSSWAMSGFLIYNYVRTKVFQESVIKTGFSLIDSSLYNANILLGLSIVTLVIAIIFTIAFSCFVRSVATAIAVLAESAYVFRAMPTIVFFPLIKYAFFILVTSLFITVIALLSTSGEMIAASINYTTTNGTTYTVAGQTFTPIISSPWLIIYSVFWYLWMAAFISAITHCAIAGAVASWYWTREKSSLPKLQIVRSLGRVSYYHLGSIALGSLIISLLKLIRIGLAYVQRQAKTTNNKFLTWFLSCCQCCLGCMEMIVNVLNKNAYIEIAIYGYSFCEAAKVASQTLMRNSFRLIAVEWVSGFMTTCGKLLVSCLTGIACLGLFYRFVSSELLSSNFATMLVFVLVISYLIADIFMGVFESTVDTIFLSFCEDCERNDGSPSKPYYMSPSLKKFMDTHKQEAPQLDGF